MINIICFRLIYRNELFSYDEQLVHSHNGVYYFFEKILFDFDIDYFIDCSVSFNLAQNCYISHRKLPKLIYQATFQ